MQASALDFAGLYTFPSPLSKVPVGAALRALNLTANQDGTGSCRRGLAQAGDPFNFFTFDYVDNWYSYQNHLMANGSDGSLWYDASVLNELNWVQFAGSYIPAFQRGAEKMRGVEANKNLFFATSRGVDKTAAYNVAPVPAGVPPGLDGTAALAGAVAGILNAAFQAAYQIVFGYTDANGNLLLSAPSERILIVNPGATADNVSITFTVPQGLTTNYFYQIYRTPQTAFSVTPTLNVPPGAEPQLATQQQLTAANLIALSVTYVDVTPDELLGAALYTNPSQQGALQTNDRPPLAGDICVFNQMMFFGNCETLQSTTVSLIAVGSANGIQLDDTVTINGVVFTAKAAQNNVAFQFARYAAGTISQNIDTTARNLIQCINANAATTHVYAIYLSGYNDLPGLIELVAFDFSQSTFYLTSSRGGAFSPVLPSAGTTFASSNDQVPNGLYVSKPGQPEAVPLINLEFVGGGDQGILRILPLRDRVIVLKTDGVFVVTGATPDTLSITPLDTTVVCVSPESAVLLNNSVYCMTNQGAVSVTESGVTIQSRAIESDLLGYLQTPGSSFFAISYESERLYILCGVTDDGQNITGHQFCYNWVTNAWTDWPLDLVSGIVHPFDNKLYVGKGGITPTTGESTMNHVYKERKDYENTDFMDDQVSATIVSVDATGLIVTMAAVSSLWVGKGLEQTDVNGTLYIAIITAVDVANKTVTVDLLNSTQPTTVIPWTAGGAFIDTPIPTVFLGVPMTAGFPHYLKDWGRVNFWFNGGNFNQIVVGFIAELQGPNEYPVTVYSNPVFAYGFGPSGLGPFGGDANFAQKIQTMLPADISKANWIEPAFALSFPQASIKFLGVTASYEVVSDVSG